MSRFEGQHDERERLKRQRERDWHSLMEELNLLQQKLATLSQRKIHGQDSVEERLVLVRVCLSCSPGFSLVIYRLRTPSVKITSSINTNNNCLT